MYKKPLNTPLYYVSIVLKLILINKKAWCSRVFNFEKNRIYFLSDYFEFELIEDGSTVKHEVNFEDLMTANPEFLVESGLHYIIASMKITDEDNFIVMDSNLFLPYETSTVCAISLLLLTSLFESHGCTVETEINLLLRNRLCDENGVPLDTIEADFSGFINKILHGLLDDGLSDYCNDNAECEVCRGGGCPHCEPYRFI